MQADSRTLLGNRRASQAKLEGPGLSKDRFKVQVKCAATGNETLVGRASRLTNAMKIGEAWWQLALRSSQDLEQMQLRVVDSAGLESWVLGASGMGWEPLSSLGGNSTGSAG